MTFPIRELYCPAHFGNSWEVMGRCERREDLAEVRHWGFRRYADWFDTIDCSDPYAERRHYQLAHALWDRKRYAFQAAQALGLETCLCITPNHVYVDQVTPALAAVQDGGHIFGQLLCPSKPAARAIILENQRRLLADLAACSVRLAGIALGPYDYGGCACPDCQPWILTFAELCRAIHEIAAEYHPGVRLHLVGWWWQPEEHRWFADWADREMPGRVSSIALHIPYGDREPPEVALPLGCETRAFIHIGYADQAEPRDVYGKWGPVVAPRRIPETLAALARRGAVGYMAYSEGVYEDVNRVLLGALSSGMAATADEALRLYAERYFGASGEAAGEWAEWLSGWGAPFTADLPHLRATFDRLAAHASPSWRLEQWALKLRLFELHAMIGEGEMWPPARARAADEFMECLEALQRRVWGLGPMRHIFGEKFMMPAWFDGYRRHRGLPGVTGQVAAEA